MLFNNNMTPAMATAGSGSYGANGRAKTESFLTKSEVDEDFNAFRTTAQRPQTAQGSPRPARPQGANRPDRQAPSKQPTRRKKPKSKPSWKLILGIGIAALVLILAIVIVVAVLFAPQKNIKMEDNVYISYIDNAGKYRLASNGKVPNPPFPRGENNISPSTAPYAVTGFKNPPGKTQAIQQTYAALLSA